MSSDLATPSNSETSHDAGRKDVYVKDGSEIDGPTMSAAPISTPIASPAEVNDDASSKKDSETAKEDDISMENDDSDKDLFGDSEPTKSAEQAEVPVNSAKPLTPPIDEQKSLPAGSPLSSVVNSRHKTPTDSLPIQHAMGTPSDSQKHRRSATPAGDVENPAKRFKTEANHSFLTPVQKKSSPSINTNAKHTPNGSSDSRNIPTQSLAKHQIKFALASLRAVKRLRDAGPFVAPVDIVKLNIPNYHDFIKKPMDLGTMERKVAANMYASVGDFMDDMTLIEFNCALFNGAESEIAKMARNIKNSFDKHMKNMPPYEQAPAAPPKPKRKSLPATATPKSRAAAASHATSTLPSISTPKPSHLLPSRAPHSAPPKAAKPVSVESKPFALQPSGIPTIRRDSSVDGRPKREIHPPRPKDLPYGDVKPRRKKFAAELKFCGTVLKELMNKKHESISFPFLAPVDPVALNCPDYFKVIKEPMDLSTISQKYNTNQYENADDFESDVRLMFRNCYKFNPEGAPVNMMGHRLEAVFDKKWVEKPVPPPTPPPPEHGSSSTDDDSDFDSDDNLELLSNPAIKVLEEQLDRMQKELDRLKKDALREARDRRRKQKQKKMGSKKPKPSEASRRKSAPNRRASGDSHHAPIEVTYEMKKALSESIQSLPEKKMAHVLTVIQESMPQLRNTDQDEIELDMDTLDPATLMKLYNYAVRKDEGKSRASFGSKSTGGGNRGSSPGAGSVGGGGASGKNKKKSKPLSEAEQTRQIEQIQKKIEQFDRAENGAVDVVMSSEDDDDDGSSDDSSSEEE